MMAKDVIKNNSKNSDFLRLGQTKISSIFFNSFFPMREKTVMPFCKGFAPATFLKSANTNPYKAQIRKNPCPLCVLNQC